ncbi:MAG: hypothetical protein ACLR71_20540 [[Clostridium] scindens]
MSVATIFYRNIKWRFHNAFTIVITILQPVLWLVFYSRVAEGTLRGAGIDNYTAFIFPGLIMLVCFSACSSSGIMNYLMKTDGKLLPGSDRSRSEGLHCIGADFWKQYAVLL